jgi:phage terminase large subunit
LLQSRDIFRMRSYQRKPYLARQQGCKRFVEKLHRRAGKDRNWIAITLTEMLKRVGNYVHVFPALNMGRRDVWDNTIQEKREGIEYSLKMIDMFPAELIKDKNETEMKIELLNGSTYQIMGADDDKAIDRLRGQNGIGYILSEYAFMNPKVWKVLSPVLLENNGWVAFISTPNVEDDDFDNLCRFASGEITWFYQCLTIEDTKRDAEGEDGSAVILLEEIEQLRRTKSVREEEIRREYYCDTKGYRHGTIYGDLITLAVAQKRIGRFSYIPTLPVGVTFDLGHSDAMAVWFYQRPNPTAIYFIDYVEEVQKDLRYIAHLLKENRRYIYGRMCLPHDGRAAEEFFSTVGFRNIEVAKKPETVQIGIDAVRVMFPQFYFDEVSCARGIECITKYKYAWDDEKRVFTDKPVHNQYSHGADALRSGVACGFDPLEFMQDMGRPVKVETEFDPRMEMR